MQTNKPTQTQVGWWKGLGHYYIKEWRSMATTYLVIAVAAVLLFIYSVAPFIFVSAVTAGTITGFSCGSKGYSYSYSYTVNGVSYAGHSGLGGLDGNRGGCSLDRVGRDAWVTYSPSHPENSIGGTIEGRFASCALIMGLLGISMALAGMPASYIKERRSRSGKQALGNEVPLSRQQKRALERRQRKAGKAE